MLLKNFGKKSHDIMVYNKSSLLWNFIFLNNKAQIIFLEKIKRDELDLTNALNMDQEDY